MALNSLPLEQTTIVTMNDDRSRVDWCAIGAGVIVAFAVPLVLLSFGSAIGLSLVSPYRGEGISPTFFVILTGLWVALSQVSGFLAGGYLTGRLRRRVGDGTPHEVEMRDGMHGLVMWGTTTLIGVIFAAFMAAGLAALGLGAAAATGAAADGQTSAYYIDKLLRPNFAAAPDATVQPAPATPTTVTTSSGADGRTPSQRELGTIVTNSLTGTEINAEDRTYAANVIALETGLSVADAEKRVDVVYAEAKQAADQARQYAVLLAFLTAASLLISAVAAWFAAVSGGDHRDRGTNFSHLARWK